jgi:hypothetical protein
MQQNQQLHLTLAMFLLIALFNFVCSTEYPLNLALAQIPMSNPRAPRLGSFCTQLSPTLVPFCSHVTYPVFTQRLLSDSEWMVSMRFSFAADAQQSLPAAALLALRTDTIVLFTATRPRGGQTSHATVVVQQAHLQTAVVRQRIPNVQCHRHSRR